MTEKAESNHPKPKFNRPSNLLNNSINFLRLKYLIHFSQDHKQSS